MMRRDLLKASLVASAAALFNKSDGSIAAAGQNPFPEASGLTRYIAQFVINTKYEDIPSNVVALGKKSILDGFGLALAGSVAESGPISRRYIAEPRLLRGEIYRHWLLS